jgi:hypothetical protein
VTRIHAADLLRWINDSRLAGMGNDRAEVRALAFMLMVVFFAMVAEPGLFIGFFSQSLMWKVASLCTFGRWPVAGLFTVAALMLLPHMFTLAFLPGKLSCQWPRKMAATACIFTAGSWAMLGYLSEPIDADMLTTFFMVKAFLSLWLGIVLGLSLNAQQARERAAALMRWQRMKDALMASKGSFHEI